MELTFLQQETVISKVNKYMGCSMVIMGWCGKGGRDVGGQWKWWKPSLKKKKMTFERRLEKGKGGALQIFQGERAPDKRVEK